MAKPEKLIPIILKWEGGWSNHPSDRGGATMRGITFGTFCEWRKQKHLPEPTLEDLKGISEEEWGNIFTHFFWNRWKADKIENQSIANILVDFAWASGTTTAIRYIQKHVLGVGADGLSGPATVGAINSYPDQKKLFELIKQARLQFVDIIVERNPSQQVFLRGWKNRINSFSYE